MHFWQTGCRADFLQKTLTMNKQWNRKPSNKQQLKAITKEAVTTEPPSPLLPPP
jgi:hypothetical protein